MFMHLHCIHSVEYNSVQNWIKPLDSAHQKFENYVYSGIKQFQKINENGSLTVE